MVLLENEKIRKNSGNKKGNDNNHDIAVSSKIETFFKMIKRTILAVNKYKILDIFGANELNICINTLEEIYLSLSDLQTYLSTIKNVKEDEIIKKLQDITNELSIIFRTFGTESIDDLISVCLGGDFTKKYFTSQDIIKRYEVLKEHVHPIGYKVMAWKADAQKNNTGNETPKILRKNRIVEDFMIVESGENLDCFDLARTSKSFQTKVYGVKFCIQDPEHKRTLIICGVVDDIMLQCLDFDFVKDKLHSLEMSKPNDPDIDPSVYAHFIGSLTLKELLVYDNSELFTRYTGYINQISLIKQKTITQVMKEFLGSELYGQRTTLIQLLLKSNEHEFQYLAYLLYDLLSNDMNGHIDTVEQTLLFDSLPWNVKKYFREAMKQTIRYTNNLANFDNSKIPLEQQICLMKADDTIKEKAMQKLKEIKSKSEDTGSKARQYLEGLLRIPFGIYKEEPILRIMNENVLKFTDLVKTLNSSMFPITTFPVKSNYTSMEMRKYVTLLHKDYKDNIILKLREMLKQKLTDVKRDLLIANICTVNSTIKKHNLTTPRLCHSGKKTSYMKDVIIDFIEAVKDNTSVLIDIAQNTGIYTPTDDVINLLTSEANEIDICSSSINNYMTTITDTLNSAVHGHDKAKRQVERIIGQWINGDKSGYCFGFEGPPGVGKTSLAKKGIANCLCDENGVSRPFAFIAIGGSSNGSTLDGHNYTYVGSTWGRIAEILMETKTMNPIIFIDELDKVSRTEHGREIIGILTHLIDSTQNDVFEDKYFSGIELDLSKALFIFSYNDVDAIDRVLLDRIHRIKFEHLSIDDKLVITKKYLFPEVFKKMGLEDMIVIDDNIIEFIIEEYTCEPGVRKLKEILFEIIGEINLEILHGEGNFNIPIHVTEDDIRKKYLKERREIKLKKIHTKPSCGVICGLWANALGKGGILPIEVTYYPSGTFLDMKLTGMQGDVMKESMTVAKTLAWSLLCDEHSKDLAKKMDETKKQGLHIHVPEGATPKDGPSGGAAITTAIYSLFTGRIIKNNIAMTGEICLQGKVTAIGGLDLKILGGIKAGVKHFLYPKENSKDFKEFMEKYQEKSILNDIKFNEVETIQQVFDLVFND